MASLRPPYAECKYEQQWTTAVTRRPTVRKSLAVISASQDSGSHIVHMRTCTEKYAGQLSNVLKKAKDLKVPKDIIDRAIKKAEEAKVASMCAAWALRKCDCIYAYAETKAIFYIKEYTKCHRSCISVLLPIFCTSSGRNLVQAMRGPHNKSRQQILASHKPRPILSARIYYRTL